MKWKVIAIICLGVIGLLAAIEVLVRIASAHALSIGQTPIELFFPQPTAVITKAISSASIIVPELAYTLVRAGIGLLIGIIIAVGIAFASSLHPMIRTSSRLVAYSVNAFPLVGFAPLIILIFGQGSEAGMIFLAMLLSYFPVYIAIEHATSLIPIGLRDLSKILDMNPIREFRFIIAPEIRSAVLNSLRLAVPASIVGATIGEWLGAQHGIGHLVTVSLYQFNAELMYAALFYVIVFNIIFLVALRYLEQLFIIPRK